MKFLIWLLALSLHAWNAQATLTENNLIFLAEKLNYEEAKKQCENIGMKLVRIKDDETNTQVHLFAHTNKLKTYWIDGNQGRCWEYSDGSPMTYSKWFKKQPINYLANKHCIQGSTRHGGHWLDIRCYDRASVICYQNRSIEFKVKYEIKYLPQLNNYAQATTSCMAQGMELIKIQDEITNLIVYDFTTARGIKQFWIDGNDKNKEGQWVYNDGSPMTYSKWWKREPNNHDNNEHCAQGNYYDSGLWNDFPCDRALSVVCYKPRSKIVTKPIYHLIGLLEQAEYNQAVLACRAIGSNLVKIEDDLTNELVRKYANANHLGQYWIDGTDRVKEGHWVHNDGTPITYIKWEEGEPNNCNNNEHCLQGNWFKDSDLWNDFPCNRSLSVICYKSGSKIVTQPNYHLIGLPEKAEYNQAVLACNAIGSNLVKIEDDLTNELVRKYANANHLGQYWIDGTDRVKEGHWVHNDGRPMTYIKWREGEPNNYNNNEHCLQGNWFKDSDLWNDFPCNRSLSVICYKPRPKIVTKPDDHLIGLPEKAEYNQAVSACRAIGRNLVKIEDDLTNELVRKYANANHLGQYWIDGTDRVKEGHWVHNDGTPMTYTKWREGEPNNYNNNEHCTQGNLFMDTGLWNDFPCNRALSVICYKPRSKIVTKPDYHLIGLPEKVEYNQAVSACHAIGSNLVKIEDDLTNELVRKYANANHLGPYWIDGTDRVKEGHWVHNDGTTMTYTKWLQGEPNNYMINEHCLEGNHYWNEYWNDIACHKKLSVICYQDSSLKQEPNRNQSESESELGIEINVLISNLTATYDEAIKQCRSKNLTLIRIDNEEYDKLIFNGAMSNNVKRYWIDGNDRKQQGQFLDSRGNSLTYKNFHKGQVENLISADCLSRSNDAHWDIVSCGDVNSVICA